MQIYDDDDDEINFRSEKIFYLDTPKTFGEESK